MPKISYVGSFQAYFAESVDAASYIFQGMTRSQVRNNIATYILLTPKFEFQTIIAPTFIQAQE